METLKKILKNQYFPAAAVLAAVLLFWVTAIFGGLSLLHNNQPPLATLTWMLFVYAAAVLTPLAGVLAAMDLVRRWLGSRSAAPAVEAAAPPLEQESAAVAVQKHHEPPAMKPRLENSQATDKPAKSQPLKKSAPAKQRKKAA